MRKLEDTLKCARHQLQPQLTRSLNQAFLESNCTQLARMYTNVNFVRGLAVGSALRATIGAESTRSSNRLIVARKAQTVVSNVQVEEKRTIFVQAKSFYDVQAHSSPPPIAAFFSKNRHVRFKKNEQAGICLS
eukprot:INCI4999.8.p2 GENE.INCI4999.8~~INCI4999.8.p2  ORF type:complete len:133 (+),score=9.99 INCI4999.8:610-1008(+)